MPKPDNFIPTIGYCIHCKQTINFYLAVPFCNECECLLKEEINIYEQENFCLKCSKINTNENVSFHKPICNTCNVIDAAEYLNYHSKFLSN